MRSYLQMSSIRSGLLDIGMFLLVSLFWAGVLCAIFVVLCGVALSVGAAIVAMKIHDIWQFWRRCHGDKTGRRQ